MRLNKSYIRQVSSLSIIQLVLAVCAYATQIRLTHEMPSDELGRLAYGVAIGLWLQVIVRLAYDRTLVRSIFDCKNDPDEVQFIVFNSLILRGIFFIAISFAVFVLLKDVYIAMIALSMAIIGLDIYPWFDSYGYTTTHAKIQAFGKFLYFIPVWIVCILNASLNIELISILLLASSVSILIFQFLFWVRLAKYTGFNFSSLLGRVNFSFSVVRPQFTLMVITLLSLATWRFPDLYMGIQSEYEALAGYALILQIITFLLNLSDQHLRMVRVRLADAGETSFLASSRYFIIECFSFAVLLSILGLIAAWVSINFFLPNEYNWISHLVVFIPIFLILYSINGLYGILVILMYADKSYARSVFFGSIVTAILSVLIIPIFGAYGAFLSLVIGFLASTVLQINNVEGIFRQKGNFSKKKILFYYYAEGNFGDDLMWSTVFSNLHKVDYALLYGKDFVAPPEFAGEVVSWRRLIFELWQYDRLCIFGGSMFMDTTNAQRKALVKLLLLNLFFRRDRIAIAGINIEPFKFSLSKILVAYLLRRAGFVWFRDDKSATDFSNCTSNKICFVGGDMAFNMSTYYLVRPAHENISSEYSIGVVVNPVSEVATLEMLREKIKSQVLEGVSVIKIDFLSFQKSKKEQDLMVRLRSAILSEQSFGIAIYCDCFSYEPSAGFKDIFDFYSRSDFVIAGRFHGVVLALITQVAYCPVVYAEKFNSFLSDIYLRTGCTVGSVMSTKVLTTQLKIGNDSIERLKSYLK